MPELWPHQKVLLSRTIQYIKAGKKWVLIQMPTGSGKTRLATEACRLHVQNGGKVLWLAHRNELIQQAANTLEAAGLSVGAIYPGSNRVTPYRPVQVASTQTLQRREHRPPATLVVTDEAHHYASDKWEPIIQYYKSQGTYGIGLSATPCRSDLRGLETYDELLVGPSIKYLVSQGVLVPLNTIAPRQPLDSRQIAQSPLDVYRTYANGKRAVIFAANVKAAQEYCDEFNAAGIVSGIVTGADDTADRNKTIEDYKAGRLTVLCNVNVLTEGWDDPSTEICILARSCGSLALFLQIIGRILRASPGKESATLIDLYGSSRIWIPKGILETEFIYSLTGEGMKFKDDKFVNPYKFCPICRSLMGIDPKCPTCPWTRPELEAPVIVNAPLYKFSWLQKDNVDQRVVRLAKWIREALESGHKPGKAFHRFRGAYQIEPTREMWAEALRLVDKEL